MSTLASENPIFYTAPTYDSGGYQAHSVAIADVNKDGKLDMVVANNCSDSACANGGTVGVLLGNGDGTFQPPVNYGSGGIFADSVAVADVNGDGKLDLVVVNRCGIECQNDGTVAVLLGNGDGTFQAAVTYDAGGQDANSIAIADVNGDGKPDLVVVTACGGDFDECESGTVGVLLGNGDGTFQAAVDYDTDYFPSSIAIGDVNGDGKLDFVVANACENFNEEGCSNGTVSVFLGNGDGTFRAGFSGVGENQFNSVALADVNGDRKLDIVVGNPCNTIFCASGDSVTVMLGNGDGTFRAGVNYVTGGVSSLSVAVGDVNGDGKPDVLVTSQCNNDPTCSNGAVSVLFGNGDGTFRAPVSYDSGGEYANSIAAADVNGDGNLDLLVVHECGNDCTDGTVAVLLGNGDGTLHAATIYGSGGQYVDSVAVADVNGDGKPDLLVAYACGGNSSSCTAGQVSVLLGNGDGTFQAQGNYESGGGEAYAVAVGDVNGDGKPDLVVTNLFNPSGPLSVLLGNGDGTFQPAVSYDSGGVNALSVVIADVNGDGKPDLVVANECTDNECNGGTVGVLLGNGDGTFRPVVNYGSGAVDASAVAVADVNGDGKPDVIVTNSFISSGNFATGGIGVLLGNGDGTFRPAVEYGAGGQFPSSVAIADVNEDGKLDLLVENFGTFSVLLGNGDGTFQPATSTVTFTQPDGTPILVAADFNGDGKLDVVCGGAGALLIGNGDGTFQSPVSLGVAGTPSAVGDFNHDGKPDLAIGGVAVLLNIAPNFRYATTAGLTSSLNPVAAGQPVTFTAAVNPAFNAGVPSGNVTFYDGTTVLGTEALSGDTATLTTAALTVGSHRIDAVYDGDSTFNGSRSLLLTQVVASNQELFAPGDVAFESEVVDTTSENTRIIFKYTGSGTITLTGLTPSSHFSVNTTGIGADPCDLNGLTTLARNQFCVFNVAFSPANTLGTVTGSVTASFTGDPSDSSIQLPLTGKGTEVYLSTRTLPFGTVLSGTKSMFVRLTNKGQKPLSFNGATITGTGSREFTVLPYSAPNTSTCFDGLVRLKQNQSCTVTVRFTSRGAGTSYSETMRISDDGGGGPQVIKITAMD